MRIRGQHVVALILMAATFMGGYAWWHAYQRGRRSLALWGSQAAFLIRYAPRVELWQLGEERVGQPEVRIDGRVHGVAERTEISGVQGLVHARHALVEDDSFVWDEPGDDGSPDWRFALRFSDSEGTATVVFDVGGGRVRLLDADRSARLRPPLIATFQERSDQWAAAATSH